MRQLPIPDALKEHVADLRQEIALTGADGRVVAYLFSPDLRETFYDMAAALGDAAADHARVCRLRQEQVAEALRELRAHVAKLPPPS